jgi:hypothetical protein
MCAIQEAGKWFYEFVELDGLCEAALKLYDEFAHEEQNSRLVLNKTFFGVVTDRINATDGIKTAILVFEFLEKKKHGEWAFFLALLKSTTLRAIAKAIHEDPNHLKKQLIEKLKQ